MKLIVSIVLAGAVLTGLGIAANQVSARSSAGMLGRAESAADEPCFNWDFAGGNNGLENNCAGSRFWHMSTVWDNPTPGNKLLSVTVKQAAAGQVSCLFRTIRTDGTIAETNSFPAFGVGAYNTQTRTLTNVPPGAVTDIECLIAGGGTGRVLALNYAPI